MRSKICLETVPNHLRHAAGKRRETPRRTSSWLVALAVVLFLPGGSTAAEPFGYDDNDTVYSDTARIHYLLTRSELANATSKCKYDSNFPNDPAKTDDINGLSCFVAAHRFCAARGHLSGFGVENPTDSAKVDITCVSDQVAEIQVVDFAHLQSHRSDCPNATASAACGVAINYHCRGTHSPGFRFGFGPVERISNPSAGIYDAYIVCLREENVFDQAGEDLPECAVGTNQDLVSTACRQAMDAECQAKGDLRGGSTYLDRNPGAGLAHLPCIEHREEWSLDSELPTPLRPEPPTFPPDVVAKQIDPVDGDATILAHNALAPNRSLSHDGRVFLSFDTNLSKMRIGVQRPEAFAAPLTQDQGSGTIDSSVGGVGSGLPASYFHGGEGGKWEWGSSAICDPHQGSNPLVHDNRQQFVPSRKSNPYSCDVNGASSASGDYDCYDLTIVTVYDTEDETEGDQLWGSEVKVIVADPKTASAHVEDVVVDPNSPPVQASISPSSVRHILEPNITGDGRLIIIQGDSHIRYAVIPETGQPCDVSQWTNFKHLHEMHADDDMTEYGIARYPLRDHEGELLDGRAVWGGYPWVDQDGDNMMFMAGASVLYYEDGNGDPAEKYPVAGHPICPGSPPPDDLDFCNKVNLAPTVAQLPTVSDHRTREGLTFLGLWTHGKMVIPDSVNNAADFGVPAGSQHHRLLDLYSTGPAIEVGTTIRTSINSSENRFFVHPSLRPDTPREVVWHVSTQSATDEVAFDDFIDPRALIVSPMNTSIALGDGTNGRFQDGFIHTGNLKALGFLEPAHLANAATAVSSAVDAETTDDLSANVQWNVPSYGYLLGGARSEPIAAGGFKGRGLWLDGVDDRLEYLVPDPPDGRQQDMDDSAWFYSVSLDPRDLGTQRRLLSLPDGSWLDVLGSGSVELGNGSWTSTVTLPASAALAANSWSTLSIVSTAPGSGTSKLEVYLDGYLVTTLDPGTSYFRMTPGRVTLGARSGGFRGWLDDLKVIARRPHAEVICNHARGTLVGLVSTDARWAEAGEYSANRHQVIRNSLPAAHQFDRYLCERPLDTANRADHSLYHCLGQFRRPGDPAVPEKCVREALLFPEGLFYDAPRASTLGNAFCLSCHTSSHPSVTMKSTTALAAGTVDMPDDKRRQPMQHPPKLFGNIPLGFFTSSPADPATDEQAPATGEPIDPHTTPSVLD